jgi:hypothetical protein
MTFGVTSCLRSALLLLVVAAAGCRGCSCSRPELRAAPSAPLRTPLGTNLDFLVDWSSALPFVDLMKTSRPWIAGTLEDYSAGPPLALDAHGWVRVLAPGQVARTLMAWDLTTHPAGRYTVLWEGTGELQFFAGASNREVQSESGSHRRVLDLDPRRDGAGIGLMIVRSDPADSIRNIRVLLPGGACSEDAARYCDEGTSCGSAGECRHFERIYAEQVFHPEFLRSMKTYSVIRFMNWADANSTILEREFETTWESRTHVDDARWSPRAPLEVMLDLCNRVHVEPWLSLPSRADDDYVRRTGELVRQRLDPSLRVWVEYSNEVWNSMFPQSQWSEEHGLAQGLATEPQEARLRHYVRRSREMHASMVEAMGGRERVVRVLAGQSASTWLSEQLLDYEEAHRDIDAFAIAPYVGVTATNADRQEWAGMDLDTFFARADVVLADVEQSITQQVEIAHARGVPLVAYEGGQHFVGYESAQDDARIESLFGRANRDPRMGRLYARYLDSWRTLGGDAFMHFVDCAKGSRVGYWGALEYLGQPETEAPKRAALSEFAARSSRAR